MTCVDPVLWILMCVLAGYGFGTILGQLFIR